MSIIRCFMLLTVLIATVYAVDLQYVQIPAKGTDNFETPTGTLITLSAGHQMCFTTIGRWNPNLEGSAGVTASSFGGFGSPVVGFTTGNLTIGGTMPGLPDKQWLGPENNFFSLLVRPIPAKQQ